MLVCLSAGAQAPSVGSDGKTYPMGSRAGTDPADFFFTSWVFWGLATKALNYLNQCYGSEFYIHPLWHFEQLTTPIHHQKVIYCSRPPNLPVLIFFYFRILPLKTTSFSISSIFSYTLILPLHLSSNTNPSPPPQTHTHTQTHTHKLFSLHHHPPIIPELQCQFIWQSGKQSQMSQRMMDEAGEREDGDEGEGAGGKWWSGGMIAGGGTERGRRKAKPRKTVEICWERLLGCTERTGRGKIIGWRLSLERRYPSALERKFQILTTFLTLHFPIRGLW